MQDLNLRCAEKWEIGLFGSIFFIGNVIGSIFLSEYGDSIGRIVLMKVSQAITLVCYFNIVFFARNIVIIYFLIFIIGLLSGWRLYLGYIYGSEIVKESSLNMAGSIFNLFDA